MASTLNDRLALAGLTSAASCGRASPALSQLSAADKEALLLEAAARRELLAAAGLGNKDRSGSFHPNSGLDLLARSATATTASTRVATASPLPSPLLGPRGMASPLTTPTITPTAKQLQDLIALDRARMAVDQAAANLSATIIRQKQLKAMNDQMQAMQELHEQNKKTPSTDASAVAAAPSAAAAAQQQPDYSKQIQSIDDQIQEMQAMFNKRQVVAPPAADAASESPTVETDDMEGEEAGMDQSERSLTKSSRGLKARLFGSRRWSNTFAPLDSVMKKAYISQIDDEIAAMQADLREMELGKPSSSKKSTDPVEKDVDATTRGSRRQRGSSPSWRSGLLGRKKSPARKKVRNRSPDR